MPLNLLYFCQHSCLFQLHHKKCSGFSLYLILDSFPEFFSFTFFYFWNKHEMLLSRKGKTEERRRLAFITTSSTMQGKRLRHHLRHRSSSHCSYVRVRSLQLFSLRGLAERPSNAGTIVLDGENLRLSLQIAADRRQRSRKDMSAVQIQRGLLQHHLHFYNRWVRIILQGKKKHA